MAVYGAYDASVGWPWEVFVEVIGLGIARGGEKDAWLRTFALACGWAALGAAVGYIAQAKGFSYHRVPMRALAITSFAAGLLEFSSRNPGPSAGRNMTIAAVLIAVLAMGWEGTRLASAVTRTDRQAAATKLASMAEAAVDGPLSQTAWVADSASPPTWPMLYFAGLRTALPYSCMWPIAGHYDLAKIPQKRPFPYRKWSQRPPAEQRFGQVALQTLKTRPALVLFNIGPTKQGFGHVTFDFRRYFAHVPGFADAMAPYDNIGRLERFEVWRLTRK